MKQKELIAQMQAGGFIMNNSFVNPDGTPRRARITQRQIAALERKGLIKKRIGYDGIRTYRLRHD